MLNRAKYYTLQLSYPLSSPCHCVQYWWRCLDAFPSKSSTWIYLLYEMTSCVSSYISYYRWISVLSNAKEEVLLKAFQDSGSSVTMNESVRELSRSIIERILKLPGNKVCCDCGAPGRLHQCVREILYNRSTLWTLFWKNEIKLARFVIYLIHVN